MATYTMKQLVEASGYPERSIRRYIAEGFVPSTTYKGKDTVYGDEHVQALRVVMSVHRLGVSRIAQLRAGVEHARAKQAAEVARVAAERQKQAADAAAALAIANAPPPPPPAPPPPPVEAAPPLPGTRFRHIPLLPGMDLVVRDDAPDLVNRLAAEIHAKYGTSVLTPPASLGDEHGKPHV